MNIRGITFCQLMRLIKHRTVRLVERCLIKPFAPVFRYILLHRNSFKPQVIVRIQGGLGNQMWQYALGYGIKKTSGLPVSYDLSGYERASAKRPYLLSSTFKGIEIKKAGKWDAWIYRNLLPYSVGEEFEYVDSFFSSPEPRYLGEYYLNLKYYEQYKADLIEQFVFTLSLNAENEEVRRQICEAKLPVAVHVRRGDYVNTYYEVTSPQYFHSALDYFKHTLQNAWDGEIKNKATIFVFSDDISWCHEVFSEQEYWHDVVFVENNVDCPQMDMYLMVNCAHFIISNSSFAWWAAFLSQRTDDKIVIVPDTWYRGKKLEEGQSVMRALKQKEWLAIPTT